MLRFLILATCFGMAASEFLLPCFVNRDASFRPDHGKFEPEHIYPRACTHLILGYAKIYPTEGLYTVFDHNDFNYYERFNALKASMPGLKTLISIGGPDTKSWAFRNMVKKPETRKLFAMEIMNLVRQFNFDGVDISWFYPTAADKAIFADFLMDLRYALELNTTISVTVSGHPHLIENHYDAIAFAGIVNFINVQTYDYYNGEKLGLNAPLYAPENDTSNLNVEYSLNLWHKLGMPKNKIVMGIPTYGRVWYLEDKNNTEIGAPALPAAPSELSNIEGVISYAEMCRLAPKESPWGGPWDNGFHAADPVVKDSIWFSYENERSILQKITFAMDNGFAGAFINSLDMDDFRGFCNWSFWPKPYPLLGAVTEFLRDIPEYQPATEAPPTENPDIPYPNPCEIADKFIPWNNDYEDCRKYYFCIGRVPHHLSCSEGLFWDQLGGHDGFGCTFEYKAYCQNNMIYPHGLNFTKV